MFRDHAAKIDAIIVALVVFVAAAGFAGGLLAHAPTFTNTRTHRLTVAEQYGAPSQSLPGAQVNQALTGMTCDVYVARKTVLCHP